MGVAARAKKLAMADNLEFPDVFFISVDPERDKVEMLADYVQYFDKSFIGVTGDKALIKALTLQMSVVYMKMSAAESSSDGGYLIDHSSALLLLNPEGKLVAFLNPPHDPKTILKDVTKVTTLQ
jgi:protein SCO1/2